MEKWNYSRMSHGTYQLEGFILHNTQGFQSDLCTQEVVKIDENYLDENQMNNHFLSDESRSTFYNNEA